MELSKKQQKLIENYKKMPSFLQAVYFEKVYKNNEIDEDTSFDEYASIVFKNSSDKIKIKFFNDFVVGTRSFSFHENLKDFFKSLPENKQESILENLSGMGLTLFLRNATGKQQEKYFQKYIEVIGNATGWLEDLDKEVLRGHKDELLSTSNDKNKVKVVKILWDVMTQEEKNTYYDLFLKEDSNDFLYKWKDLDEETKEKNITKIFSKCPNYDGRDSSRFLDEFWHDLSDETKIKYINDALKKAGIHVLRDLSSEIQNTENIKSIINSLSEEEKLDCFDYLSPEYQIDVFDKCEDIEQKTGLFLKMKPETIDKNFEKVFDFIRQTDNYGLARFISHCPAYVLEKNSNVLGEFFSSDFLKDYVYFIGMQHNLIDVIKYLKTDDLMKIIDVFYDKGLSEVKYHLSDEDRFLGKEERNLLNEMYINIDRVKQKELYIKFIDDEKYDRTNKIYNMMQFENIDEAKEYIVMYFEKFNPEKIQDVGDIFEKLYEKNNNLSNTINFEFLSSDLANTLTEEQLLRVTLYPKMQEELVNNKENIGFSNTIVKVMETDENWTIASDLIIKNINSKQYDKLLLSIKDGDLDEKSYENLMIALSKKNYFGIETKEDIEKYFDKDGKRNKILLAIMRGEEVELPECLSELSKEELRKFAVSEYLLGMDLEEINKYSIRYQGIKEIDVENSEYIKKLVNKVTVLNNADSKQIDQIIEKIKEGAILPTKYVKDIHLDSKAINIFSRAYEQGLYHPGNEDEKIDPLTYEGKQIGVYRVHNEFKMLARVEGAYNSQMQNIEDYKQYYNSPNISAHGNCESVIGQDQIGLAKNLGGDIVIGYKALAKNSLLIAAPYDLASADANKTLSPLNNYRNGENIIFHNLQEMIDYTRHNHNEVVSERVIVDENGNVIKLMPDYLIWIEERKTDEFPPKFEVPPEDDKEAMEEYKAKVHLWKETQKAASQLGIPIVVINREECAEQEMAKVEEMKKMLKGEIEIPEGKTFEEIASETITKFENNAVGLRFAKDDIKEKYFNQNQRLELINIIKNKINEIPKNAYQERYEALTSLNEIIQQEYKKYIVDAAIRANKEVEDFYNFQSKSIQEELLNYEQYIGKKSEVDFNLDVESKEVFERDVQSIAKTNYYDGNKAHSIEHIEKVMLFSLMIAKNEGIEGEDLRKIMAAAAFHDSFRGGNDGNSEHAEGSAELAKQFFENNPENGFGIEQKDISLIQVAIEYHEYRELMRGKIDKEEIMKLCDKYGYKGDFEKAVQISTILKDADALDRERFARGGKLDPNFLHTESAKSEKMISLARRVNGRYAKEMLEKNYDSKEKIDELEAVSKLREKRIQYKYENGHDPIEDTLSADEMLILFDENLNEYTRELNDTEKKKNILNVFEEIQITKEDEKVAKKLLGIDEKVKQGEIVK